MWYTLDCLAAARTGFIHSDHLGSTSLTTDISGTLVAETRYLPYGEERWITGTMDPSGHYIFEESPDRDDLHAFYPLAGQRRGENPSSAMWRWCVTPFTSPTSRLRAKW
jgi:hypothetical protein